MEKKTHYLGQPLKYYLNDLKASTIASVSLLLVGVPMALILVTQTQFIAKLQTVQGAYLAMCPGCGHCFYPL